MIIKSFNYKFVNSTNDIAINLIKQKNIKAGFVLAEKQKKGRGQRGKKWISYKGNLFISIFFSLEKINLTLKQLTKTNTKLIIKLISQYYKKKIKLKLPNDILINNVGGVIKRSSFLNSDDKLWQKVINLNLMSAVKTTRIVTKLLMKSKNGVIFVK